MSPQEVNNLVQGIFDGIFDSVTKSDGGSKPLMHPAGTVLSLMKPGKPIRSLDFRNPWTPGNSKGSKTAALNTASLLDAAPRMSTLYAESGNEISKIYGDIIENVQVPTQPPNPAIEAQLQKAYDTLYRTVSTTDPETGEASTRTIQTALYHDYDEASSTYFSTRAAYMAAYNVAQETATGRATWPMVAPTMQMPVKQAYDKWRSNFADKIEQAVAIMDTSTQNALSKAFNKAKMLYQGYGAVLDETGSGTSPMTMRSYLLPSDWHSMHSATKWTTVDTFASSFYRSESSEFSSYGAAGGFMLGCFAIGGKAAHASQHQHISSETKGLRFSFEYALVTCRRPWANFALLSTKGWNLSNLYGKGAISNGTKHGQDNSVMPLLPMAFVVARNVKVSAEWSQSDYDLIKKHTSGGGVMFGIGPFCLGGSYEHSSSNETFSAATAGKNFIAPGVQIIGVISQVVPYCPPAV